MKEVCTIEDRRVFAFDRLTRLTRLAGDRILSIGTRRAPPYGGAIPFGGDNCGIRLERRRKVFSLRIGPICDRRRLVLVIVVGIRGVTDALFPLGKIKSYDSGVLCSI